MIRSLIPQGSRRERVAIFVRQSWRAVRFESTRLRQIGLLVPAERTMPGLVRFSVRSAIGAKTVMRAVYGKALHLTSRHNENPHQMILDAQKALGHGDLATAQSLFLRVRQIEPFNEDAAFGEATIEVIGGNYLKAQRTLTEATVLRHPSIKLQLFLASVFHASGSFWEAERWYHKILKQDDKAIPAWMGLAELAMSDARYDEAAALYEKVLGMTDAKELGAQLGLAECGKISQNARLIWDRWKMRSPAGIG
jgi:tetratricopeptide (TPR) repeat protein